MHFANHRLLSRLSALGAIALLTSCASLGPQLPMSTTQEADSEASGFAVRTLDPSGDFKLLSSADVARRLRGAFGERSLSILALSSGGASGAFGAGALAGSGNDGRQNEFQVVTGVSAGALLAPFAFLGSSWDSKMTAIYTTGVTDTLLQPRGLGALFGSSVYSGEPLRRLIERYADDGLIAAVAHEAAKGRLLLIATTDFTNGEPVVWDLSSIALNGGENAKSLFQSVLLASASVPGMLPPVVLRFRSQGRTRMETHVDGGVTLPFFIAPAVDDLPRAAASGSAASVHVIIDGPLRDWPRPTHANALSIFSRSLSAGLSYSTRAKLESTAEALHERGISLDYAAIPASYPLHGAFDFTPDAQRTLFRYAASCAEAGRLWIHSGSGDPVPEHTPVSGSPACPADDSFFGRLAAFKD